MINNAFINYDIIVQILRQLGPLGPVTLPFWLSFAGIHYLSIKLVRNAVQKKRYGEEKVEKCEAEEEEEEEGETEEE